MAWRMALLGHTIARGGQASGETSVSWGTSGSWGTERYLRLALPSAVGSIGSRLDRHRADSQRAVAPAERGPARALGASKRQKPREWPRSGVQPKRFARYFFTRLVVLFRNSCKIHGNGTIFDIIPLVPQCHESRRVRLSGRRMANRQVCLRG